MTKGDIVLIPFPFTDLTGAKLRPTVVLHVSRSDVVVAFITSNVSTPEPWDLSLAPNSQNGLKLPSTVKTSKIATVHTGLVAGKLGQLNAKEQEDLDAKLKSVLQIE